MGGILENKLKNLLISSQNNLLNIVSYYFTQEESKIMVKEPLMFCRGQKSPDESKKEINNYPLISYKFDFDKIKYTKYKYRQMKVLQMIMLTPNIFISITEECIQLWHNLNGIQKINLQFFDFLKNNKKCDIEQKKLVKFDNDLFYITFKLSNGKYNEKYFYIYSATKIIKDGKILEIYSTNKFQIIFPINNKQILIVIKNEIKIYNILTKKLVKTDKIFELFKFNISFGKYLFDNIIILCANKEKKSIIYSIDKKEIIYFIEDKVDLILTLGNNKVIIISKKIKELLNLPDLYSLPLEKYETDIFNSIEDKSFFPVNEKYFLLLNHKTKKLKKIILNENNELIVIKDISCPNELITFCPFIYSYENNSELLCSLYICNAQTYTILDNELKTLVLPEEENNINLGKYSSIKRLFLDYFDVPHKEKGIKAYIPYAIIENIGASSFHFAAFKNKKLYELKSFSNYFEPNINIQLIIDKNDEKNKYIVSLIKNMFIYIVKINEFKTEDKIYNYNFGNIKTKGMVKIFNNKLFIYYDKKGIIIDVIESFKSKINPEMTFLFPFEIIYSIFINDKLILVTNKNIYNFDYKKKKITHEIIMDFSIQIDDNINNIDINILNIQDDIYILIVELKYFLFNIKTFKKITKINDKKIKNPNILFFNSSTDYFEIILKNIITDKNISIVKEKTDEQKHKMRYISKDKIFVGIYPNKFFIFESNNLD